MREINFRAWDKKEKEMIDINSLEIYDELDKQGFYSVGEVLNNEDWEIMQYTGLKDKNSKGIYEGDIVANNVCNAKVVVEWEDEIRESDGTKVTTGWIPFCTGWANYIGGSHFEVIGNIYENPELLKDSK
jgi:uncharacterized phage protein (TIGR01671 family)